MNELNNKLSLTAVKHTEPIAIIGMSCRFPGAGNPEEFWQLLKEGKSAIKEVPLERWKNEEFYNPNPGTPGKSISRWGGFIENVDLFDPYFFGISPREAQSMDPQQRLLLEVTWEALEQACLAPEKLAGSQTGVFVGIYSNDYSFLLFEDPEKINAYTGTGSSNSIAAGRISYTLDLRGPSIAVDTACSSALVAIHLACQSLRSFESDLALASGIHLVLRPEWTIAFSQARMLAKDGQCKTFDAAANGYVRGEGCGVVVLKRLSDAQRDNDNILALIRGSAVNQDGHSNGLSAPSVEAQKALLQRALVNAGVSANQISYVEAHGTGTALGDRVEAEALTAVLRPDREDSHSCAIGSVKTNIGHLEAAAGMAGIIKVILAMQHKCIPPNLNLKQLNSDLPLLDTSFFIPTQLQPWPEWVDRLRAGVSGFSFGGTNAHVILEEAPACLRTVDNGVERPWHILTLSAKDSQALRELAKRYEAFMSTYPATKLADICFTANVGRSALEHRLSVRGNSAATIQQELKAFAEGTSLKSGLLCISEETGNRRPKIAFLFTGQGSQYPNMAATLYKTQPVFRQALDNCAKLLLPYLPLPLLSVIYSEQTENSPLHETRYTQPAIFAVEYALAQLWQSWGILPDVVMGHSVGEYVAACVAGVFSLEDGLKLIAERGRLMQSLPAGGAMAAVFTSAVHLESLLTPYGREIAIAAINGPENTVISGTQTAVAAVLEQLASIGIEAKFLKVSHAFHSPLMEPILTPFEQVAQTVTFQVPRIPLIVNQTGQLLNKEEIPDAVYWRDHIRQPVQFAKGLTTLGSMGVNVCIEVGPHTVLTGMATAALPDYAIMWLSSLRRGQEDWEQILSSLQQLHALGVSIDWAGFERGYQRQRLSLPTYPFQRERYWIKTADKSLSTKFKKFTGAEQMQNLRVSNGYERFPQSNGNHYRNDNFHNYHANGSTTMNHANHQVHRDPPTHPDNGSLPHQYVNSSFYVLTPIHYAAPPIYFAASHPMPVYYVASPHIATSGHPVFPHHAAPHPYANADHSIPPYHTASYPTPADNSNFNGDDLSTATSSEKPNQKETISGNSFPKPSNQINSEPVTYQQIEFRVMDIASTISGVPTSKLQPTHQLHKSLGFDSLMITEMRTQLMTAFPTVGIIPNQMFFNQGTIAELTNYIYTSLSRDIPVDSTEKVIHQSTFDINAALAQFDKWAQEFQPGQIQRIAKELVHKDYEINVLISRLEKLEDDIIIGEMVQDTNHPFFYEHPKDHVPGMYLIEVARQGSTVLSHNYYNVSMGKAYILDELKADFTKFVEHDRPAFWIMQISDKEYVDGELLKMRTNCLFVQNKEIVAVIGGVFRMLESGNYNRIRSEQMQTVLA
jgi:acyl transferase domain-containing protein